MKNPWAQFVHPGKVKIYHSARLDKDEWQVVNGDLFVGMGTDLGVFCFYVNLTDWDREFLKSLQISDA